MMAGHDRTFSCGQRVDCGERLVQGCLADGAFRPVQAPLRARCGLERDDRNARKFDLALEQGFNRAEPAVGIDETFDQVEIGQVMVADLDRDRHAECLDPLAGGVEFAVACPHRQVAGNGDGIGLFTRNALRHPVQRAAILQTEVDIANVEQAERRCGHIGAGDRRSGTAGQSPAACVAMKSTANSSQAKCSSVPPWLRSPSIISAIGAALRQVALANVPR